LAGLASIVAGTLMAGGRSSSVWLAVAFLSGFLVNDVLWRNVDCRAAGSSVRTGAEHTTVLSCPHCPPCKPPPRPASPGSSVITWDGPTDGTCFCREPLPPLPAVNETQLIRVARSVAIRGNVFIAVSDGGWHAAALRWVDQLARLSITNYVVIALDDAMMTFCGEKRMTCVRDDGITLTYGNRHPRELVSAKKFSFVAELLAAGVNAMLMDTDIAILDNPLCYVPPDVDLACMSDGWSPETVMGWHVQVPDPPLPDPWEFRVVFLNSGMFYVKSSVATVAMFRGIAARLAVENVWDQAAFNDEIWFAHSTGDARWGTAQTHGGHRLRWSLLDYKRFANSKVRAWERGCALMRGYVDARVCAVGCRVSWCACA
jgi:hypothetical protein